MIEYLGLTGFDFGLFFYHLALIVFGVGGLCYFGFEKSMKPYSLGVKHGQHDFSGELVRTESDGFKRGYTAGITDVVDFIKADLAHADAEVTKKPVQAKTTKPVVKAPIKKVVAKKVVNKPVKKVLVK